MSDLVGQRLGNYHLLRLLGQGGFASVYLGKHQYLETQAAIKVLNTRLMEDEFKYFSNEARTIANLVHPNIVRILEFGVEDKTPFLVMDYAPGGTLRQRHHRGMPVALPVVVTYVKQVAQALQFAHDRKLIHRDIKPENMLLGQNGDILLADFGIAVINNSSDYRSREIAGTVAYIAPEQFQGRPQTASDQYALGIVVYEWLTGTRPFQGSFVEIATQHMFTPPPSLREIIPTLSQSVEQVVLKALAKEPKERFISVQAFSTAFEQACQSTTFIPQPYPSPEYQAGIPLAEKQPGDFTFPTESRSWAGPNEDTFVPYPPTRQYEPISHIEIVRQKKGFFRRILAVVGRILWGVTRPVRQSVMFVRAQFRKQPVQSNQRAQQLSVVHPPVTQMSAYNPSMVFLPAISIQQGPAQDFFIMYNRSDRPWAEWIAWQLEEAGYSVVLPAWDFRLGSDFNQQMQSATTQAKRIIAVLSPDYLNARSTQFKWTTTFMRNTVMRQGVFLPIYVRECGPELRKPLQSIVHIDLVGKDESLARDILLTGVRFERGKPTAAPAFPGKRISRSLSEQPPFPAPAPSTDPGTVLVQQMVSQIEAALTRREASPIEMGTVLVQQMVPKIAEAFTKKDWPDVIRKIDLLIKRTPTNISSEIYRMQWQALLEEGETLRAREAMDMALALVQERSQRLALLNDCTNILAFLGLWNEMVRYSNEALRLAPNDPEWLTFRQLALTHIAELEAAVPHQNQPTETAYATQPLQQKIVEPTVPPEQVTRVVPLSEVQPVYPLDPTVRVPKPARNIKVFFSYAHQDEALRNELDKQLSFLKHMGLITSWHDREIRPGTEWANEIDHHLSQARIIILLISSDFIASEYCYTVEMRRALERHALGEACVIPVILRPVHWQQSPFGKLQALPTGARPVTTWINHDEALLDVAKGIQKVVERMAQAPN